VIAMSVALTDGDDSATVRPPASAHCRSGCRSSPAFLPLPRLPELATISGQIRVNQAIAGRLWRRVEQARGASAAAFPIFAEHDVEDPPDPR